MNRTFILNPQSGNGLSARAIAGIAEFFQRRTGDFNCALTRDGDDAEDLARRALRNGADQIVAVGGDGTINAVVNGFFEGGQPVRPDACLAIADLGTGSDYYRTACGRLDWKALVLDHAVRPVDVGRAVFGAGDPAGRRFVNMASVGLSADVVRRKNRGPRWLPRRLQYLLPTIASVLRYRPRRITVEVDGETLDGPALALCVCKGRFAGGGIPLGGGCGLDDGLFDVTLIGPLGPIARLLKLRKLYSGTFKGEPAVRMWRARSVSVRACEPLPVELDGEDRRATHVEFSISRQTLRLCVPRAG